MMSLEKDHSLLFHFFQESGNDFPRGVQVSGNFLMGEVKVMARRLRMSPQVGFQSFIHILEGDIVNHHQEFFKPAAVGFDDEMIPGLVLGHEGIHFLNRDLDGFRVFCRDGSHMARNVPDGTEHAQGASFSSPDVIHEEFFSGIRLSVQFYLSTQDEECGTNELSFFHQDIPFLE